MIDNEITTRRAWLLVVLMGLVALLAPVTAVAASAEESLLKELSAGADPAAAHLVTNDAGHVVYLGAPADAGFRAGKRDSASAAAQGFVRAHEAAFGLPPGSALTPVDTAKGDARDTVRLQQTFGGIPVFGAQVIVQVGKSGLVTAAMSDVLHYPVKELGPPAIDADEAASLASAFTAARYELGDAVAIAAEAPPELVIYAAAVLDRPGDNRLAWRVAAGDAAGVRAREQVFVDAMNGAVLFHYPLIHSALDREIYNANNTSADPGTLARSEGDGATSDADVDLAYEYFGDTYNFYANEHGRDGIDGAGTTMSGTVRYCDPEAPCPYANAFWSGTRMYFGEGFSAADDVVAHELTHGVTQNTSGLIYSTISGALNESFSDVWGEFVDLENGSGTDTPEVRWLLGEDVPGFGAIRDMANPPAFDHPDSTCSLHYVTSGTDRSGVHINSGVSNKFCFLLTDGGSFRGETVSAMGIPSVADLYYEVQTNLILPAANWTDFHNALTQAAINLGFDAGQQANVQAAARAVGITPDTLCQAIPANDDCENAIPLQNQVPVVGSTHNARGTQSLTCGDNLGDFRDVWYQYTAAVTGFHTINMCTGTDFDTTLGVFDGSCAAPNLLACDDDGCGDTGGPSGIGLDMTQGQTYFIRVAGWGGAAGQFRLVLSDGMSAEGEPEGNAPDSCAPDAIYGHAPLAPDAVLSAPYSDAALFFAGFDEFAAPASPTALVWWGLGLDGSNSPCAFSPRAFELNFHSDNAGRPAGIDASVTVTPTIVETGTYFVGYPVLRFEAELLDPGLPQSGWLSIVETGSDNCTFAWYPGSGGNSASLQIQEGVTEVSFTQDLAFCLIGDPATEGEGEGGARVQIHPCLRIPRTRTPTEA